MKLNTVLVAYVPGSPNIIDTFLENGKTAGKGMTFAEVQQRYPGAILTTLDKADQQIGEILAEVYYSQEVEEFNNSEFYDRSNMVPSLLWQKYDDVEVIVSSEIVSSPFTTFYVRISDRCFTLTHSMKDIKGAIARVRQAIG